STLVKDASGVFWGTTTNSYGSTLGAIYKFDPVTLEKTNVYQFTGVDSGTEGTLPESTLLETSDGKLIGTTRRGGANGAGTVFKIDPLSGELTNLAEFTSREGVAKGREPSGGVIADPAGNLWGTTRWGGAPGYGTIYKLDPTTGAVTTVAELTGIDGTLAGSAPVSRPTRDAAGNIWVTASEGLQVSGNGKIFKVDAATGVCTIAHDFDLTQADGLHPFAPLTADQAGELWGTTMDAGFGEQTLFRISPSTGEFTHVFDLGTEGRESNGELFADQNGNLWGTTQRIFNAVGSTVFK